MTRTERLNACINEAYNKTWSNDCGTVIQMEAQQHLERLLKMKDAQNKAQANKQR